MSCACPSESFCDRERQLTDLRKVNGYLKETALKCEETYNLHAPQYCDADARWKSALFTPQNSPKNKNKHFAF